MRKRVAAEALCLARVTLVRCPPCPLTKYVSIKAANKLKQSGVSRFQGFSISSEATRPFSMYSRCKNDTQALKIRHFKPITAIDFVFLTGGLRSGVASLQWTQSGLQAAAILCLHGVPHPVASSASRGAGSPDSARTAPSDGSPCRGRSRAWLALRPRAPARPSRMKCPLRAAPEL